jgi:hydrogenase/urease accessory protein HupE
MNRHVLAALFLVGFLLLTVPLLLMQHPGVANASLTTGFVLPLDNKLHSICLLAIGCIAAWIAGEMLVLLPICGLLMLVLGAFSQMEVTAFPELRGFTVGAILLFSLAVSMMRHRVSVASVVPIAAWAYFTGNHYMTLLPEGVQPLYFMLGISVSAALLIAIGVALTITLMEMIAASFRKLKTISAFASLFSLF